jgi:hypothetical protein
MQQRGRTATPGTYTCGLRVAATVQLVALEMVPAAVEADLDDIAGELVVRGVQPRELGIGRDAAAVRLSQLVAVDVRDQSEAVATAHRAHVGGGLPDVAAGPQQLGMRVTDLGPVAPAGAQVTEYCPAGQDVVDMATAATPAVGPRGRYRRR